MPLTTHEQITEQLLAAQTQIEKCHLLLDRIDVPRSVPVREYKYGGLYDRLRAYVDMCENEED